VPVELLFLNHQEVASLLSIELVLDAVRQTFIGEAKQQLDLGPAAPMPVSEQGWLMAMPAALRDEQVAGVKWLGYFNRAAGDATPTSWANILVLNRIGDGLPFAFLDCTEITSMRTAGGHAVVAAQALARSDAKTLAVLGTGVQAAAGIRAFDASFNLEQITVYSRSPRSREKLVAELAKDLRASISAVDDPETLARSGDILLTCSAASQPVLREQWIAPGTTVVAVSAFHDLDPALAHAADRWFLGNRTSDVAHILEEPKFADQLDARDVRGTIGEVLAGRIAGRTSADERVLFTHMGMGALDVAVGYRLYQQALAQGRGQKLRLAD
jgi:ornithine cyclodeaminase/alanine dehydrogenase-like protein (mu-crystallin family)